MAPPSIAIRIDEIVGLLIAASKDLDEAGARKALKNVSGVPRDSKYKSGKGKAKKKGDPNRPKKPLTAFMFYSKEMRKEVEKMKKITKLSKKEQFGAIGKALGKMWKKLSEKEQEKWIKLNKKDIKRHEKEMKKYTPPKDDDEEEDEKSSDSDSDDDDDEKDASDDEEESGDEEASDDEASDDEDDEDSDDSDSD